MAKADCICSSRDLFNHGCRCSGPEALRVWHNGIDWVVAHNLDEARRLVKEWCGYTDEEADGDEGWAPLPDDKELTIHDGPDDDSLTKLTAKEWVDECGEPQILGSREW